MFYEDEGVLNEFKNVICDECGTVVAYCENLTDEQIQNMLDEHEEYYLNCIKV